MHSTHLRREHIHGLLLGVAIGDALGLARVGLNRRTALKMFGRPPLRYKLFPGNGIYGDNTRLMLLNAQALLTSRSDLRTFRRSFRGRLSWYLLSLPVGVRRPVVVAAMLSWLLRFGVQTGSDSSDNRAATRAIFSALAMNGTGHDLQKWITHSTKLTHTHPAAISGCCVLAFLAEYGALNKPEQFDPQLALSEAIAETTDSDITDKLQRLVPFLQNERSPSAVARHFGWDGKVGRDIVSTAIMASYCWLRYPGDFRRAVESAITLGGDSASMGAIVGGLVGSHVGQAGIPSDLRQSLGGSPHGPEWIESLAERFSRWPHGEHDLHAAPALTSDPPMQLIRNVMSIPIHFGHFFMRWLHKILTRSTPRRRR